MKLSVFINHLVREGQVAVVNQFVPFTPGELKETTTVLQEYYDNDILEMPGAAPIFNADAALWAAQYVYRTVQLALLRESGLEAIIQWMQPYTADITDSSIYSADLCLRYLPDLLHLSKGLSPDDPLVQYIRKTAALWPFSSTGMNLPATGNTDMIIASPSLLQAYADRIIASRDQGRCNIPAVLATVNTSLGNYANMLWPEYKNTTN
ncbi:hypothetical protein ACDQ55_10995 [Chitinophaga sp. 30R24]|uniref:hypothetical protein n=1 Tax=Chitinophaga sp. 30R24 TaxID=3248838 RepID=UPI003B9162A0